MDTFRLPIHHKATAALLSTTADLRTPTLSNSEAKHEACWTLTNKTSLLHFVKEVLLCLKTRDMTDDAIRFYHCLLIVYDDSLTVKAF